MTEPTSPPPQSNNAGAGKEGQPPVIPTPPAGGEGKPGGEPGHPTPKGAPEGARVVPDTYNLSIPKDSTLDNEGVQSVADFAKKNQLTNNEAQAILEREHDLKASIIEGQQEELELVAGKWLEESKADAEIGGEHFDESVSLAKRVVDKFGSPAFKKALNDTKLGNHPELLRFAYKVGKHLKDDSLVFAGAETPKGQKTLEEVFYGDSNKK